MLERVNQRLLLEEATQALGREVTHSVLAEVDDAVIVEEGVMALAKEGGPVAVEPIARPRLEVSSAMLLSLVLVGSAGCVGCAAPVASARVAVAPGVAPQSPATPQVTRLAGDDATPSRRLRLGWPIWIGVVCDDLEAQRHFYRDVLGLEERNVSVVSSWFLLDGKLLELLAKSDLAQYRQRGVAFGFAVDDVRAARSTLLERGVEPVGEVESDGHDHWAYFRDAEGNLFELAERPH